jgi:hypothetical protein
VIFPIISFSGNGKYFVLIRDAYEGRFENGEYPIVNILAQRAWHLLAASIGGLIAN